MGCWVDKKSIDKKKKKLYKEHLILWSKKNEERHSSGLS